MPNGYVGIQPGGARADSGTLRQVSSELSRISIAANDTAASVGLTTNGAALEAVANSLNSTATLVNVKADLADSFMLSVIMRDPNFVAPSAVGDYQSSLYLMPGTIVPATSLLDGFIAATGSSPAEMYLKVNTIGSTTERHTLAASVGGDLPLGELKGSAGAAVVLETQTYDGPGFSSPQSLHRIIVELDASGSLPAGPLAAFGGSYSGSGELVFYREMLMPAGTTHRDFADAVVDNVDLSSAMQDLQSTVMEGDSAVFRTFDPLGAEVVGTGGSLKLEGGVGIDLLGPIETKFKQTPFAHTLPEDLIEDFFPKLDADVSGGVEFEYGNWHDGSERISVNLMADASAGTAMPGKDTFSANGKDVFSAEANVGVATGVSLITDGNGEIVGAEGYGAAEAGYGFEMDAILKTNLPGGAGTGVVERVRTWTPDDGVSTHVIQPSGGGFDIDKFELSLGGKMWEETGLEDNSAGFEISHMISTVAGEEADGWWESAGEQLGDLWDSATTVSSPGGSGAANLPEWQQKP